MNPKSKVFVSGHRGLVGSAITRVLTKLGFGRIMTVGRESLDLRDPCAVDCWFDKNRPEYVFHVAGTVGGIYANQSFPADFAYDNILIHATVLRSAWRYQVKKLLYVGSSCIYPRDCPQPIREEYLLKGPLEPTNSAYAIAKISGLVSCQAYRQQYGCNFISAMPTNCYGPNDNFDLESAHVLPAMIRKFHEAKRRQEDTVVIWGSGTPRREFLHADDLADALVFLMHHYNESTPINVGSGVDCTIAELADLIRSIVYPHANVTLDVSKPDGTPRKILDVSRINQLGWSARIELRPGIENTYRWFASQPSFGCGLATSILPPTTGGPYHSPAGTDT